MYTHAPYMFLQLVQVYICACRLNQLCALIFACGEKHVYYGHYRSLASYKCVCLLNGDHVYNVYAQW